MKILSANQTYKIILLIIIDMLCAALAVYLSAVFRFLIEYSAFPVGTLDKVYRIILYWLPANTVIFALFKMYNRLWEFASVREALRVVTAVFCSFLALVVIASIMDLNAAKSCYPLVWFFQTVFALGTRFFYRISRVFNLMTSRSSSVLTKVMIIGAGNAGNSLIREIESDRYFSHYKASCVIDDDPTKTHRYIGKAKVIGGRNKIVSAANKYDVDEIIFAIPSADDKVRREFFEICKDTSCVIKTLPSIYQMVSDSASISMLRKVEIADLLDRPQIELDLEGLCDFIHGKTVLVTGAGGSIGSELCRQLATYNPAKLVIFDVYENSTFYIQNELNEAFPQLDIVTLIGSVRDFERLNSVFSTYKPDIVYHAAAHKHVPLMEGSPNEAVKNNVFGTLNIARVSDKHSVSRFVMISTDKAVNPTNVMGATKRICEMIIQYYNKHSNTEYVAVRFGNVLGSNGSVIPTFSNQIENGGPVTVTHPEVIRFFMTIPEAVSLVLQAGTFARGGEIFVLDMGEPVKILNLAENMIRLSGLVPYKDIEIVFTGLRPGEKIFEELLMSEEGVSDTPNKKIFIGRPIQMDESKFINQLEHLKYATEDDNYDIRSLLKEIVPTYNYIATTKEENALEESNIVTPIFRELHHQVELSSVITVN